MSQNKGLQRDTIDKFYTKESAVKQCMIAINDNLNINNDLFPELTIMYKNIQNEIALVSYIP